MGDGGWRERETERERQRQTGRDRDREKKKEKNNNNNNNNNNNVHARVLLTLPSVSNPALSKTTAGITFRSIPQILGKPVRSLSHLSETVLIPDALKCHFLLVESCVLASNTMRDRSTEHIGTVQFSSVQSPVSRKSPER